MPEAARSVIIVGAAGRDFHNFNVFFRDNPRYRVVAFTAAQIPDIAGRRYPAALCGARYPDGIPVFPESELARLIRQHKVNDVVFYKPDITVTLLDPTRPGEEDNYFPGEANIRAADVLVIAKANVATAAQIEATTRAARAARLLGATLVDPRPYAVGSIAKAYSQFPHLGPVLPALGYTRAQREELRESIAAVPCAAILLGTPADLTPLLPPGKPVARISVAAKDLSALALAQIVLQRMAR